MTLSKDIERLCHQVSVEKDGDKLLTLVDQLNKQLEGLSKAPTEPDTAEAAPDVIPHPENESNAA